VVLLRFFLLNRRSNGESNPNTKPMADGPAPTITMSCRLVAVGDVGMKYKYKKVLLV
jgi:hypothetical protein